MHPYTILLFSRSSYIHVHIYPNIPSLTSNTRGTFNFLEMMWNTVLFTLLKNSNSLTFHCSLYSCRSSTQTKLIASYVEMFKIQFVTVVTWHRGNKITVMVGISRQAKIYFLMAILWDFWFNMSTIFFQIRSPSTRVSLKFFVQLLVTLLSLDSFWSKAHQRSSQNA